MVTEAVMQCEQLTAKQRRKILWHVEHLSRQALLPPDKRVQPNILEWTWSELARGIEEAGALAELWHVWGARIRACFGFSASSRLHPGRTER
jgi:hypothetical protein